MSKVKLSSQERRQQIISSAIETFSEKGYYGTRMDEIAHRAEINIALVYKHFPDKDSLFDAILKNLYSEHPMIARLSELVNSTDDFGVFYYFAHCYATLNQRDVNIHRLLLFTALERPELYCRHFEQLEVNVVIILASYISKRIEEGAFRPVEPAVVARLFASQALVYLWETRVIESTRWADCRLEEVLSTMVDIFVQSLQK